MNVRDRPRIIIWFLTCSTDWKMTVSLSSEKHTGAMNFLKLVVTVFPCCLRASLVSQMVKNLLQRKRPGFNTWLGQIAWRREWQPAPVSLPGNFHGQRSMVGYSPWVHKESNMTEWLKLSLSLERLIPYLVSGYVSMISFAKCVCHSLIERTPSSCITVCSPTRRSLKLSFWGFMEASITWLGMID